MNRHLLPSMTVLCAVMIGGAGHQSPGSIQPNSKTLPRSGEDWYSVAPLLVDIKEIGSVEVDFMTPAHIVGDTLATWFDRTSSRLVLLDLRTSGTRTIGRSGRGPMEFSALGQVKGWQGDSILVLDNSVGRGTVVSLTSGQGRSIRYIDVDDRPGAQLFGRLAGGTLVTTVRRDNTQVGPDGLVLISGAFRLHAADTSVVHEVPFDGGSMVRYHHGAAASVYTPPVVQSMPSAVSGGRLMWINANGDSLLTWNEEVRRSEGVRLELPVNRLNRAEREQIMSDWLRRIKATPSTQSALRRLTPVPASVNAVRRLQAGSRNSTWLRVSREASDSQGATMIEIDAGGIVRRCFRLDATQRLMGIGATVVLLGKLTDDGTFSVRRAQLQSGCPARASLRR